MSHLRKLQRDKQTRINGIKYAPLIHDPNLAHFVALSNMRESKKLSDKIKSIEQQREKSQHHTQQAEQMLLASTKAIVKTSGSAKRDGKDRQLPNIVLTKADARRSKLASATTFGISPRKSVPDIMNLINIGKSSDYSRPRSNSSPYLPSIREKQQDDFPVHQAYLDVRSTTEQGFENTRQSKRSYEKTPDSPSLTRARRLSMSVEHLLLRRQTPGVDDRRASDSKLEELKQKDLILKLSNEKRRNDERKKLTDSQDRRNSLFLSLPLTNRSFVNKCARPSICIMETVVEDLESESILALSRSPSRGRAETT